MAASLAAGLHNAPHADATFNVTLIMSQVRGRAVYCPSIILKPAVYSHVNSVRTIPWNYSYQLIATSSVSRLTSDWMTWLKLRRRMLCKVYHRSLWAVGAMYTYRGKSSVGGKWHAESQVFCHPLRHSDSEWWGSLLAALGVTDGKLQ